MRIGFVGGSYTAQSGAVADEECINFFASSMESQGAMVRAQAYGGMTAGGLKCLYGTPGTKVFSTLPGTPHRGSCWTGSRSFAVGGDYFVELAADGTQTARATIANDGLPVSITASNIQLLIVSAGRAYCYTLADNSIVDVTDQLAGFPVVAQYSDGYFIVQFKDSNKFQMSAILDGTTWPGIQVNAVSVFPENVNSILVNHRELWVFGTSHIQPYQDTGNVEIFDVIPCGVIEQGNISPFSPCRVDNTIFWVGEDERGGRVAWRAQGYTPQRISTYAVEFALSTYANVSQLVSYSYQERGHTFWVLYVPGADCSWVYDIAENLWHKRAFWTGNGYEPHHSWNHVYAFGKHLVGDWKSGNIYELSLASYTDDSKIIRRLRQTPIVSNEMEFIYHAQITIDFETGLGPQPPLVDGNNAPRPPQAILQWSDDRGKTWSNERILNLGFSGEYRVRAVARRLGRSRYRVYRIVVTDPIPVTIVDAYLRAA